LKAVRLLQIVLLIAAVLYLVLLHDMNDLNVVLPFLIPVPPALAIVAALGIGALLGWLPGLPRRIARGRELRNLRKRLAELEGGAAVTSSKPFSQRPVIPDREPTGGTGTRSMEPDAS